MRDGVIDQLQTESFIRTNLMRAPTRQATLTDREGSTWLVRVLDVQNQGVRRVTNGGEERDVATYQLVIIEVGLVTDAATQYLVWNEDAYNDTKAWSP